MRPNPDNYEGDESMQLEPCTESEWVGLEPAQLEQSNPNNSSTSPVEPNLDGDFDRRVDILEPNLHDDAKAEPRDQNFEPSDQMDVTSSTSIESPPRNQSTEPDTDDPELRVIQDPVTVFCSRLQSAVQSLRNEAPPSEVEKVLQTLIKIIGYALDLTVLLHNC